MIPFPYQMAGAGLFSLSSGAPPPGPSDPYWSQVTALLHFDGANNSTSFVDETGRTWTRAGNAVISTVQSKFGGSSLSAGTTGYIQTPRDAGMTFGAGDFTIEAWIRPTSAAFSAYSNIFSTRASSGLTLRLDPDGKLQAFHGGGLNNVADMGAGSLSTAAFTHVAFCRQGSNMLLARGGKIVGSAVLSDGQQVDGPDAGLTAYVGVYEGVYEKYLGFIDELRITKGVARYTADYTPPAAAFPAG